MTNGYADKPLAVLRPDGSWDSFSLEGNFDAGDILTRMIVSQEGDLWMLDNRGGVVAFSPTREEGSDNPQLFKSGNGNGGLPVDEVFSIAEDLDGEIWVGTSDGVAVFYSPFDAFSNDPSDARQILVEQDGIFQFLLEAQSISAIAIDGANRKWIGTFGSGVFLLSEDGTEQILRFTADQSPLFSDVINDIVVDNETGEVFIATVEGILSYQGDATGGEASNECLTVYPNPVRETYSGPVTIEGIMRNSDIRITDMRGNLVASLVSNGGRAIWDGKNLNGERVATGVYFALVSSESADSQCVSKILMIK
ncbi:MAG: ligand-binding sensor domain-containing protein [Flammeovirgaceae bacterium]|jgi:ligand-binding sensor domain-containing protein